MMKQLSALLLCTLLLLFPLSISAKAGIRSNQVMHGTPYVDGQLDPIYYPSASTTIDVRGSYTWGGVRQDNADVSTYYLWDEDYLYVCCVVSDDDVLDVGADRYKEVPDTWTSECTEVFFDFGGGRWKIHMDAFGRSFYFGDNRTGVSNPFNGSTDCWYYPAASEYQAAVSRTDDGYITEFAFPLHGLSTGVKFTTSTQVVDMTALGGDLTATVYGEGYCSVTNDYTLTLVADDVGTTPVPGDSLPPEIHNTAAYAHTAPVIDGYSEAIWETVPTSTTYSHYEEGQAYSSFQLLWDEGHLYFFATVFDETISCCESNSVANGINFWVSETNSQKDSFNLEPGDWHIFCNQDGKTNYYTGNPEAQKKATLATQIGDGYYTVECAMPLLTEGFALTEGHIIGFDVSVDDDVDGDNVRDKYATWADLGNYWEYTHDLANVKLVRTSAPPVDSNFPVGIVVCIGVFALGLITTVIILTSKKRINAKNGSTDSN